MPRTTGKKDPTQWSEPNHDIAIPGYVKERVIRDADNRCRSCRAGVLRGSGHIDHILPLEDGGEHAFGNLQYLCKLHHNEKTSEENSARAKGKRIFAKTYGIAKSKGRSFNRLEKSKSKPTERTWYYDEDGRLRVCTLKPTPPAVDDN